MNLVAAHELHGGALGQTRPTDEEGRANFAFWTPARLREHLAVSETTEAEWRSLRLIEYFKVGRNVRYSPGAVMEFIARHTMRSGLIARTGGIAVRLEPGQFEELERRLERFVGALFIRADVPTNKKGTADDAPVAGVPGQRPAVPRFLKRSNRRKRRERRKYHDYEPG
jgi:hypothetical protein